MLKDEIHRNLEVYLSGYLKSSNILGYSFNFWRCLFGEQFRWTQTTKVFNCINKKYV